MTFYSGLIGVFCLSFIFTIITFIFEINIIKEENKPYFNIFELSSFYSILIHLLILVVFILIVQTPRSLMW